jgi:hypothetical protein
MPNENYHLASKKITWEKLVDQERARLKFLNSEIERIEDSKKFCLDTILHARREILKIDRELK